ncbi:hypothetical protein LEN26_009204 [Aphanomyces euteiches]|nr:hypothetical protein AeMF1_007390 [Aphanomyces euteiches]KAH9127802.1 hypothetical protein LEN26_009204 [Aphanomyces euteiches]
MLGVWSVENNASRWPSEDKDVQQAMEKFATTKSFRKDYLGYCKLLKLAPHPKLCPKLDEEDKDLLHQSYDESDVDTIIVRNWMLDTPSTKLMTLALSTCASVHTIKLFNASLNAEQLAFVCNKIPTIPSIKTLHLEWNAIPVIDGEPDHTTCFARLLSSESSLTSLSLRANGITAAGTSSLSKKRRSRLQVGAVAIADMLKTNTKLLVLNLFRNDIQDDGTAAIAFALPTNSTLLHLSVANNGITSQGVLTLVQSLTRYNLREEQVQQLSEMEPQIQAALEAAKKQKKKLDRSDLIKELKLPDTETVDGVVYGIGNATLQSLTISGNALSTLEEFDSLSQLLKDHQEKLKTHLQVIKAERMVPSGKALTDFLLL